MFWHKANIQGANYEEVIYLLQVMDELSRLPQACVRALKQKDLNEHVEITELVLVSPQDRHSASLNSRVGGKKVMSEKPTSSVIAEHCGADPQI